MNKFLLSFGASLVIIIVLQYINSDPNVGWVVASNDTPLGAFNARNYKYPEPLSGHWNDLNWLGYSTPGMQPNISTGLFAMINYFKYVLLYIIAFISVYKISRVRNYDQRTSIGNAWLFCSAPLFIVYCYFMIAGMLGYLGNKEFEILMSMYGFGGLYVGFSIMVESLIYLIRKEEYENTVATNI